MKIHIPSYNSLRALVVGDIMLDRYWSGTTSRISPEAPVPIVHVQSIEERPGGAGNVALNLATLGAQVELISICGDDQAANSVEKMLSDAGVTCYLHRMPGLSTVTKLRVLSLHQQLIRLDFESTDYRYDDTSLKKLFKQRLAQADIIIFSDYAKGCLDNIHDLIQCAQSANKPIFVDPKRDNFKLYQGATILTPNRREFEAVVGACKDEKTFLEKGLQLLKDHCFQALLITCGEEGMVLICPNQPPLRLPAFAHQVYDVTGAGDTVIASFALSYAATQKDLIKAAQLANIAASIVVGKLGTATVTSAELSRAAQIKPLTSQRGVFSEAELKTIVGNAKTYGEKIVMTCGCFDILHPGHVAYLEQAKCLGDRLIVAVNDDASVSQLKGSGRPVNNLEKRLAVLAGLKAIDWIVPFSEPTPKHLIKTILPDIWVKGAEYQFKDFPEYELVKAYGGQVTLIDMLKDCSTSDIISAIKKEGVI